MICLARSVNATNGHRQFNVHYMKWETFLQALLNPQNHQGAWDTLKQADCLIGGVDTSISYLYVLTLCSFFITNVQ